MLDDVIDWLAARPELQVIWLDWAISRERFALPDSVKRVRLYPIARYLHGFDFAVSAAGYNAYHELLTCGLPTIFMPNENPMMDDQLGRALYARWHGFGECLRKQDAYGFDSVLSRFLDRAELASMRQALAGLSQENGANEAARLVEEAAFSVRADLDQADDVMPALRPQFGRTAPRLPNDPQAPFSR